MPEPTEILNGVEWSILQAFQSHRERLKCKGQYSPLEPTQQRLDCVEWGNANAFFDTGMRQFFTNRDLNIVIENKLGYQQEKTKSHLRALCVVLDRFVNVDLWPGATQIPHRHNDAGLYPNFNSLLRLLAETTWTFELATGHEHILFRLDSKSNAIEADEVIQKFNDFFSRPFHIPRGGHQPQPPSTANLRGGEFRDRSVAGLTALFAHLPQEKSESCNGHQVLVKLPDWGSIDPQNAELSPVLELFLSRCLDDSNWQASHCYVPSSIDHANDLLQCTLCFDIEEARISPRPLRLFAIAGGIFMSPEKCNDIGQYMLNSDCQPAVTLHDLISDDSFVDMQTLNPLMRLKKRATQRFTRNQKRSLAARLALSLSLYLDSDYPLRSWDPKKVFFVKQRGQYERDLIYVFTAMSDKTNNVHLNQSTDVYIALARLLLEIEYGISLENFQLNELKEWVDDALFLNHAEQEAGALDEMIDIRRIHARKNYLAAVRDLLNFKRTYIKGSRRLTGRSFDIGAIAREIIFVEIAEKIRSTIEPTTLQPSAPADLKEKLSRPLLVKSTAPSFVGHVLTDSGINCATQLEPYHILRPPVIELFDELDESSQDLDKVNKASYFFERLKKFHDSCIQRATQICGSDYVPHTRIRIAVLDTGVNKTHGRIAGAFFTGRIKDDGCRSWVGSNPADFHDSHGHGTNVTDLLLQVAPWAEICVGKVFSGNEFSAEEAKGVAKAIRYAADEWHADIITMSFGLKSPNNHDEELKAAFRDIEGAIKESGNKIYFAAAANHGSHGLRAFPANDPAVICIHASDGKGKDGRISPEPDDADHNFMTLGISIPVVNSDGTTSRKSGTSYATPIAAAMAAHILYVTGSLMKLTLTARNRLRTGEGMRKMLDLMCRPKGKDGYRFVAPWVQLWKDGWHDDVDMIRNAESIILRTEYFRF